MSAADDRRATVLDRVRTALGVASLDRARRAAVTRRLERHPRGTIPARAARSLQQRVALFADMLAKQGADVVHVATPKDAVGAIASYLGTCNLPPIIRMGADPVLAALPWREAWDIERVFGPAEPDDRATLSRAVVAAAETGTLFLTSGPDNPTSLNFLPEAHSVLVAACDIVGSYEEGFDRLREIYGEGRLPRSVNLISGPSRTADIEQTIVRGAHGPRRVLVLILGEIGAT
jgi:L-lactate dehydrogenase complex protein LldG